MYVHTHSKYSLLTPWTLWLPNIVTCMVSINNYRCKKYSPMYQSVLGNTGRFVMFSMITNIYNKKTKRPSLIELFTATGKLKTFFFWTTRDDHEWHGTHRYDIQVLATHSSTWVHRYSSLLQWSVSNGGTNTRSLTYPQIKNSQGVMSGDLGGHSISGWSFQDARATQRLG